MRSPVSSPPRCGRRHTYEAIVGPRSLKTADAEGDCVYDWKNLTTERAVYLGMGAEYGNANVHRFRLEDGSTLEFLTFCWTWLDD